MGGYIYFDKTGVFEIDNIAGEIMAAGDSYHHTSDWTEAEDYLDGQSYVEEIQSKLNDAAKYIQQLQSQLEQARELKMGCESKEDNE